MRSRKFSFDIPRLKIGPSKADHRMFRDQIAAPLDSPIEQPRSVRPPLSPIVEAELRSACAYVLQNFKPSHVIYKEQHGDSQQKQQLDYAAIKESAHKDMDGSALLAKVETSSNASAAVEDGSVRSDSVSSDKYKYKPEVPTQELFKKDDAARGTTHRKAQSRAEQLMAPAPSRATGPSTRIRSVSHSRSASNHAQTAFATVRKESSERPAVEARTDSMETSGSTPQTDSTDYPWSEKASTAMTSAVVTPARGSKRTSSQALHSSCEASSIPRIEPTNGDWMRHELAKHKRAMEERIRQDREREALSTGEDGTPTQTSTQATSMTPAMTQLPRRKPVPQRTQSKTEPEEVRPGSRQDSRMSIDRTPNAVFHVREHSAAITQEDDYPERNGNVTKVPDRPASRLGERARSITRQVRQYVRPDSAQDGLRPAHSLRRSASRASISGRAASVTRLVKDYIRPDMTTCSRKPSVDLERGWSRAQSMDTSRPNLSDEDLSAQPSNKWQTWRSFHRKGASRSSEDGDRPGTACSMGDTRGRTTSRDPGAPSTKTKPHIDLNRKLPPLPSLDQWQDASATQSPAVRAASPQMERSQRAWTPALHTRQESKQMSVDSESGEVDQILATRMGSPRSHKHLQPVDVRVPPQPTAPPPAIPVVVSATMRGPADLSYDQYAPAVSEKSISQSSDLKKARRRSKSVDLPEGFHGTGNNPSMYAAAAAARSNEAEHGQTEHHNHATGSTQHGQIPATAYHTPIGHSRNNSDRFNLPRKMSVDDYSSRMHDNPSQNMAELFTPKRMPTSPLPHVKDRKWWRFKAKVERSGPAI
ncbi:hypothetical protein Tdes44962_MAKER00438 [Teratosphaeria destructans]|uniref:Uncharacterized protein n=1 Tax=Teratosphaeria destructans TaxID=418781 RepID=A0A9W7SSG7_9PEZI|nr:hypothetical protein Tdes44962_MAKER00438 [Teratosphaeria destructans]